MFAWWDRLERILQKPLIRVTNLKAPSLKHLIQIQNALPNHRQRWCTRILKIEPTIAWCVKNAPVTMYVGLRADEDERERASTGIMSTPSFHSVNGDGASTTFGSISA
jgi:3'-phosphoadenosine 5'-phosphosulfate sulfotransferase (PAPS reductase)/FAD synthetase